MDSYVDQFQSFGGSMVMLAKGNRSRQVREACARHGGFYLGSIGGPAARLAQDCIKKVEVVEYPELGMEAIWKIEVEDFPAFIVLQGTRRQGQRLLQPDCQRTGRRAVEGSLCLMYVCGPATARGRLIVKPDPIRATSAQTPGTVPLPSRRF
jgi:hypothetical protein